MELIERYERYTRRDANPRQINLEWIELHADNHSVMKPGRSVWSRVQ